VKITGAALRICLEARAPSATENGALLGSISIGDLVKSVISDQEFVIEQLEHCFCGRAGWFLVKSAER